MGPVEVEEECKAQWDVLEAADKEIENVLWELTKGKTKRNETCWGHFVVFAHCAIDDHRQV